MPDQETDLTLTLAPTSWAVLGMLSFGVELTGIDLKKWADYSFGLFYWSPSVSQVYSELKKLEKMELAESRDILESGVRGRRVYAITDLGREHLTRWARNAPIDRPVLKHGVMLRLWMGHLQEPERLKSIVETHIQNLEASVRAARESTQFSSADPEWAFSRMSARWAERYFLAEIDLARQLLTDIDEAAERFSGEVPGS